VQACAEQSPSADRSLEEEGSKKRGEATGSEIVLAPVHGRFIGLLEIYTGNGGFGPGVLLQCDYWQ
jgi:hypothetical protein